MNTYEYLITDAEDPALKGRVLAFGTSHGEAEAQLRSSTFNGAKFLAWKLVKVTELSPVS
jgi:hypothetical protein